MTKKLLFIGLLLLVACQCGTKDFDEKLSIILPPIPDGEVNHYRIATPKGPIGEFITFLRHDWIDELPVYVLVLVTHTNTGNVEISDSSLVFMRRSDLKPLTSFRFVKTGSAMSTTAANYGENSIAISTWTHSGEEKQRLLPTGPKTFDTDQLTFIGRGLKLDPDRPAVINVVDPMGPPAGGTIHRGEFRIRADETVTVPAGTFACRRFTLSVAENEVDLWYERAGTGRLVLYRANGSGITIELLPGAQSGPVVPGSDQP